MPAGNYLCRGEAGDIWPQNKDRVTAKYTLTDEVDEQGWRKCDPKPDAAGVMAAQVPHAFQVQAKWGLLSGKPGDFIVKNYEDRVPTIRKMCGSSIRACLRRRTSGWLPDRTPICRGDFPCLTSELRMDCREDQGTQMKVTEGALVCGGLL